ncbi:MAG TPA: selenoneine biosynthesis selenosugar synthase SenB [Candidatus Angelobacter sp.]|nr:selenoneine biosynthesis selenosugar synthase SenB [Candidatus Angelobacter sp.]
MNILIINPARTQPHTGNRTTSERWARLMRDLGHHVEVAHDWTGPTQAKDCDLLVTLHARRSFPTLERFHRARPGVPVVVALTGTDLYQDIQTSPEARQSLEVASRLVVLQPRAVEALPTRFRGACQVIYQSAETAGPPEKPPENVFRVCVLAHLRAVKDPLRAAYAARDLPPDSRIQVAHAGGVLDAELAGEAEAEQRRNSRYCWFGDLPRDCALRLLAGSHVLALTSQLEGGANVVSEAIAAGVPVLSTSIPGSLGILGDGYPGYFPAGDTRALSLLMLRAETDPAFYGELKRRIDELRFLVDPRRERESWHELLNEVSRSAVL